MAVLTRAAFETYLTLNYIFIQPQTKIEKDFRFKCWDMAGYIERGKYPATREEHEKLKTSEKNAKNKIVEELKDNTIFQELNHQQRKNVLKGKWRIDNGWVSLAEQASLGKHMFQHFYSYLCSYSHSGRLSIIQIEQIKDFEKEKNFSNVFLNINLIILSRLIIDYIKLFPICKESFDSNKDAAQTTRIWIEIGNKL